MRAGLFPRKDTGNWWKDHSLSLVVITIFAIHIAFDMWTTRLMRAHARAGTEPGYWLEWSHDLNESVGAEPWGVLIVVLMTKWFYERDSDSSG